MSEVRAHYPIKVSLLMPKAKHKKPYPAPFFNFSNQPLIRENWILLWDWPGPWQGRLQQQDLSVKGHAN